VPEAGSGFIGDLANENGYMYYSIPFLDVLAGGTITSINSAGKATTWRVTGGIAWFDHQLGTVGRPATAKTLSDWNTASLLQGLPLNILPVVDRGFSIVGKEHWWAYMFQSGPLKGYSFMGTSITTDPLNAWLFNLADAKFSGFWFVPDGKGSLSTVNVNGTAKVPSLAGYPSIRSDPVCEDDRIFSSGSHGSEVEIDASNIALDGTMQWSKGDLYSEAGLELTASDGSTGIGWAEQIGWDRSSTARMIEKLKIPATRKNVAAWNKIPAELVNQIKPLK